MPTGFAGAASRGKGFGEYTKMLEDSHARLGMMEAHLKEIVQQNKVADARMYEDEHRIIPAIQDQVLIGGVEVPCLRFDLPQGEAWKAERMAFFTTDENVLAFFCYRDNVIPSRLAEVAQAYTNTTGSAYSDSFSNRLYLPERTRLIVLGVVAAGYSATVFDGNIQVQVLKRHIKKVNAEEAFALSGDYNESELPPGGIEDDYEGDAPLEPHDERHGDVENTSGMLDTNQDDNQWTGDIAPPTPEPEPRPQPHWPERVKEAVEHAVEEVDDAIDGFIEKVV